MKLCFAQASAMLIAIVLLGYAFPGTLWFFAMLFFGGWLAWTFFEYCIHRFFMHELLVPGAEEKLFNHKRHHQHPHDLVVKPVHRLGILLLSLAVVITALKLNNAFTLFAGFATGFLCYNFLHYVLHQPFGKLLLPQIQRSHILHHTRYPHCGYSFSTSLWDWLFDTLPPKEAVVTPKMEEVFFGKVKRRNPFPSPKTGPRRLVCGGALAALLATTSSCVPIFSDLQSARLVGRRQVEITPYYTNTGTDSEGMGASHLGSNFGIGLSDKVDLRGKFDYYWIEDSGSEIIFGLGPKVSLVENRIAASLPIGTNLDIFQLQPSLFFTVPFAHEKLEATLSPKYLISLCEDCQANFATNLGLGYSSDFDRWALRAEYGRVIANGGGIGQFSLGLSFHVSKKDRP